MKNILKTILFIISATFLFQSFQCASKEYTSAKTSLKRGDTLAAIDYLKQEIIKVPTNTEAKLLLTELTYKTSVTKMMGPNGRPVDKITSISQLREAAKMSVEVEDEVKTVNDIKFLQSLQQAIWVNAFNEGLNYFNQSESGMITPEIDSALALWDIGSIVRPRNLSFLNLKGNAYSKAKNSSLEEQANNDYMNLLLDNSSVSIENGVYLDYKVSELGSYVGQLDRTLYDTLKQGNDFKIRRTDIYKDGSKTNYIYSEKNDNDYLIKGWFYDVPSIYVGSDLSWNEINTSPVELLAQNALDNENYDQAIMFIDKLLLFRPYDRQLNQLKVQSYVNKGDGKVAVKELNDLIAKDPTKKEYYLQLGDLYSEMKDYEDAVTAYEKAINIDKEYDYALRNLASVYKNLAANIQEAEIDKQKADKNYEPKTDEYFPLLEKSADYFKRATKTETFKKDLGTYLDLYNIYNVMGKKSETQSVINSLEELGKDIPKNREANYLYKMLKIYSDAKMNQDVTRISRLLEEKGYTQ